MKKVININLGGMVFAIEEDAFAHLEEYLSDIKDHFKSDDSGDEIIVDIESSIAEKFSAKNKNIKHAVTSKDVKKVISELGTVEDLDQESSDEAPQKSSKKSSKSDKKEKPCKRIYRDSDDVVLGGVCSGLAKYFSIDPVVSRILFIIFTFITDGFGIFVYIVLWVIVPKAKTASQKISMKGESPSLESIKKFMEDKTSNIPESTKNIFQKIIHFPFLILKMLVNFIKSIFPFFRILFGAILFFVSGIMIFVLTLLLFMFLAQMSGDVIFEMDRITYHFFNQLTHENDLTQGLISFYLSLIIPFIFFIAASVYLIFNRKSFGVMGSVILIFVWMMALSYTFIFGVKNTSNVEKMIHSFEIEGQTNPDYEFFIKIKDEDNSHVLLNGKLRNDDLNIFVHDEEKGENVNLLIDLENLEFTESLEKINMPFGTDPNLIGGDAVATPIIKGQKEFSIIGDDLGFSPENITVTHNDKVTLRYKSNSGKSNLMIYAFNTQTEFSQNRGTVETVFIADKKGSFPIYSTNNLGDITVVGQIIVE